MSVILDTCGLLWLTLDPSELSGKAHRTIQSANKIIVCSASLWEIALKNFKGKIELGMSINEYVNRCEQAIDFDIVPVDHKVWVQSALLNWEHRDPIDRLIVTLAKQENATIVTDDQVIKKYYKNSVG